MQLHALRLMARRLGIEIQRANRFTIDGWRLRHFIDAAAIDVVLDVGANTGQFGRDLRRAGYGGEIISFEPLPDAHSHLVRTAQGDSKWRIAPPLAIADRAGVSTFHISKNSVSSSLLEMEELHKRASAGSEYHSAIEVRTERLDAALKGLGCEGKRLFLKIDTQGSEALVLDGASSTMNQIVGIQLELSLAPLYTGQQTFKQLFDLLDRKGYSCWDLVSGFRHQDTARLLQVDGIFFRDNDVEFS